MSSFTVGDVTHYKDIRAAVTNTVEQFGHIYALVNNSGGPPAGTFDQFDDDACWQDAFKLTLLNYTRSIREAIPYMKKTMVAEFCA